MQFKKILSIILTLILTMGICPAVFATDNIPDGYIGIYTAEDLNNIRNNLSGKYILMNDIDLSIYENWEPLGTRETPFTGVFDGGLNTIHGFKITEIVDKWNLVGLFGEIEGTTLKNIILSGIINIPDAGIIRAGMLCAEARKSEISNCATYGSINISTNGHASIGAILGHSYYDDVALNSVSKCKNNAVITANGICDDTDWGTEFSVGGVVGDYICEIDQCVNSGDITVILTEGESPDCHVYTGGICGISYNGIKNSYNTGNLYTVATDVILTGGIAGTSLYISSCYNIGNIEYSNQEPSNYAGGIVGLAKDNDLDEVKLSSCYCIDNISKAIGNSDFTNKHNVKILSESEMKNQSSYVGFDFENAWKMGESGYPVLRESVEHENPPEKPIIYLTEAEIIKVPFGKRIVFGYYPKTPEGIEIKLTYSNGDVITDTVRLTDNEKYYVGTEIVLEEKDIMLPLGKILTYGINEAQYFLGNENVPIAYKYLALPSIVEFIKDLFR